MTPNISNRFIIFFQGVTFNLVSSTAPGSTCDVIEQGQCIITNSADPFYTNDEDCTWAISDLARLEVLQWDVEPLFDRFVVSLGGGPFEDVYASDEQTIIPDGLDGLIMSPSDSISFLSDFRTSGRGVIICACEESITPPTAAPTQAIQPAGCPAVSISAMLRIESHSASC